VRERKEKEKDLSEWARRGERGPKLVLFIRTLLYFVNIS
jgi:hypothetical protein